MVTNLFTLLATSLVWITAGLFSWMKLNPKPIPVYESVGKER